MCFIIKILDHDKNVVCLAPKSHLREFDMNMSKLL